MSYRTGIENQSPAGRSPPKNGFQRTPNSVTQRYLDNLGGSPLSARSPAHVNSTISLDLHNRQSSSRSPSPAKMFLDSTSHDLLRHSSTAHFRNLAQSSTPNKSDPSHLFIPGVSDNTEEVTGVQGRLRLQKNENVVASTASKNWMDNQRKSLQAYEYLCHIGEAKEWIENCIGEEIAPIVKLDEALRDGVTLAKLTKKFAPHIVKKIFESPKLQFRHTQNINYFFQFLDEVGIPELFTFELTDLYDKKNIPKVIYCIHALGFILAGEDLAAPIGNLLGQYDFTEEELRNTQRGLDAAGVSLPNFKGMNKHFGSEEPQYTEEELRASELVQCTDEIVRLQAICRGALHRFQHNADRYLLSSMKSPVTDFQARARGYLVRRSVQYKKDCLNYLAEPEVIKLQAIIMGYLLRSDLNDSKHFNELHELQWTKLQAAVKGKATRKKIRRQREQLALHSEEIIELQSIIRASPLRKIFNSSASVLQRSMPEIVTIQAIVRGEKVRKDIARLKKVLRHQEKKIIIIQSCGRAKLARNSHQKDIDSLHDSESWLKTAQAKIRGNLARNRISLLSSDIKAANSTICDLQSEARGYIVRRDITEMLDVLDEEEDNILSLQSLYRAGEERKRISRMLDTLELAGPSVIRLQSAFRGLLSRFSYTLLLEELDEEHETILAVQSLIRGHLVRKKFADRMSYFKSNMESVIKIQSFVRAKKQGDAYKSLTTGKNPPLSTVKSFVHLLNDSDLDFEQEVELEQMRKRVVDEVRNNEMLEQFIQQLDVKIALLLKNKITLDEVIRHRNKGMSSHMDIHNVGDTFNLKALNKTSRQRLELYQGLFYILQTQPVYLAKLFTRLRENVLADKEAKDIESLMMTLFGHGNKPREEFFLLQLISRCIKEDINLSDSPASFLKGTYLWWKLVAAVNRGSKERKQLRTFLGRSVSAIADQSDCDLESDPLAIYRASINAEEIATGRRSQRDPNVSVEMAIQDPQTRTKFIQNLQKLRECSSEVFDDIEANVDAVPYYIRFIAREMYRQAKLKFFSNDQQRSDSETRHLNDKILSMVGHVVFHNYINPAIIAADSYGITNSALSPIQTKNLTEIVKVLSQIASLKTFSRQNVFLQPLNDYIKSCITRMRQLFNQIIDIPEPEQQFGTTVYDDLTSHQRPTLYIKTADIFSFHSLIVQETSYLAPNKEDPLRDVITELGTLPNDASEILNIARFTEIKIDLNPSYCRMESEEAEINLLYVSTKRCMIYVLRVQTGTSLLAILVSPVSPEHEDKYRAILKEEQIERKKRGEASIQAYHESSLGDLSKITYRELKLLALEKVMELEAYGKISRDNDYQEILNSIAYDIRTKSDRRVSRRREMENIEQTLAGLAQKEKHLQQQLETYNDYIEQAMNTLQTKKGKKKGLVLPFTKQYFHMRDLQKSGRVPKFGSYKYSAANLYDKGILVDLQGYADRQLSQVTFTFSSDQIGVFNVEAAYGSIALPGANSDITLDELLSEQYNNKQCVSMFDEMVKFNTNLMLHFIFKKFYGDSH